MPDHISKEELSEMKESLAKGGVAALHGHLKTSLGKWKSVPLRIAIVGESAVGKSSFINAVRGLFADDAGAAEVGTGDTTQEPSPYPHPDNPNVVFWDLPGVGTPSFPQKEYISKTKFVDFDFFLLFSDDRFTANDVWLSKEIRRRNKDYFCIRTKIDDALKNAQRDRGQSYDENEVIQDIKTNCVDQLQVDMSKVYVVNNHEMTKWEFPRLLENILSSLPEQKRQALLLTLGPLNQQVIQMKADALRGRAWKVATAAAMASGALGAIPYAGGFASALLDVAVLVEEVLFYTEQFHLNTESFQRLAEHLKIPVQELGNVLKLKTAALVMTPKIAGTIIRTVMFETAQAAVSMAAMTVTSILLPVVGAVISSVLSFGSAMYTLSSVIWKLQSDAERVADVVLKAAVEEAEAPHE